MVQQSLLPVRVSQRTSHGLPDAIGNISRLIQTMFNTRNRRRQTEENDNSYAFIFDMDGAVVDSLSYHKQAWKTTFTQAGVAITPEDLDTQMHGINCEIVRRLAGDKLSDTQVAHCCAEKDRLFRSLISSNLRLIDGARKFLDEARALQISMALVTMLDQATVEFILDKLYLRPYFTVLVIGEDIDRGRPHPDLYLKASLRLGKMPEECIAFENSHEGVEAACRAGMKALLVGNQSTTTSASASPNLLQVSADFRSLRPTTAQTYSQLVESPA